MKQLYNQDYFPPIPVLPVRFSTPEWELSTEMLEAIVDTGADGTLVPFKYLQQIEASVEGHSGLRSQWGERRTVNLYLVDIEIEGATLPGIWVVGDEVSDEVVLGRNVLNRLQLLLDGLANTTEILKV
ncbi:MAG: retroviral-like aspartic protease family protein [Chloroflexi bacterium]|nr:retroviral-like aspartic protease family protein [Chloroflexota bacterium]